MIEILVAGIFGAAVLFLVTAGLQLIFGVLRIVNLASGSFYALGAFAGASAMQWCAASGVPLLLAVPILIVVGMAAGFLGIGVEFVLRAVQGRDESLQLLVTFALVLIFQDGLRFVWGAQPRLVDDVMAYHGQLVFAGAQVPTYHIVVMACSAFLALSLWWLVERTGFGQILKACAENSAMAAGLGVDTSRISLATVTLGSMLSAIGGALVIPTTAATLDMSQTLIVEAFAVIVIGGLGSIKGALAGAAAVGMVRTLALVFAPEIEIIAVYAMAIAVLLVRPHGLFGRAEA